ncbi:toluene monooxygenase [Pseudooceanicola lipolyticus]|uniref:Toluene monooxygenase n=1 Tax=Pseudooceanicola lipolyticus TaxID=2029104 RepID=A0A2M8J470_9RHOB|nr:MmoB/DmpM family protein [Pseudooceanicola lipolyticus]MCC0027248.1 MmoB/DmpM family protein [Brucellaceae bacterium]PJE37577.1 toluene monooxygenase [Pseudooceanicola lipolyticus]
MAEQQPKKLVGPIIRGIDDDIIDAVIGAAEQDNPDREILVEDRSGYVRVQAEQAMVLTEKSLIEMLGRPFRLSELEPSLVSFAGRLNTMDDRWEWALR